MLVSKALNTEVLVLTNRDTRADAIKRMDRLETRVLPVVQHDSHKLIGQIRRDRLEKFNTGNDLLEGMELEEPVKVFLNQHLFHAIQLMLQYEMRLLPVVDDEWHFKGVIKKQQVLGSLGQMLNLTEYGSVITVELNQRDFTLSEIVQLIETEGGKILGIGVEPPDAVNKSYKVSIKLNLQDVSRVASALRRYGYSILTEAESESNKLDLETRAGELLKYIDM